MAYDYNDFMDRMSDIMRMLHLAARMDTVDIEEWRGRLLRKRRDAYEQELTIQAAKVGCFGRAGRLGEGDILSSLNDQSHRDAASIANTFNYFLASAIVNIRAEVPTANRRVYAARIAEWERRYWAWKQPDIDMMTAQTARASAQGDFYQINSMMLGSAKLEPRTAVCPVCRGWVKRGLVPLRVALQNPPPYHNNCVPSSGRVRMADGANKRIDQVRKGELVATRKGSSEVIQVFQRYAQEVLYTFSVDGQAVQLTGDHPVLTVDGWRAARELQVGDEVVLVSSRESDPDDK